MDRAAPRISICVPYYRAPTWMLQQCIASALAALPADVHAEILLVPSDATASDAVRDLTLPPPVRTVPTDHGYGLVQNWNRCLGVARGSLVHLLHEDDVVAPDFYRAILALEDRFPGASLYATATAKLGRDVRAPERETRLLQGVDAARFLLADDRHGCGNVVLKRSIVTAYGVFLKDFPYGPDEEAYLRWAAPGGVAVDVRPLYFERAHPRQLRRSTWLEPDFGIRYTRSRLAGAANIGPSAVDLAKASSARRLTSVAVDLAISAAPERSAGVLDAAASVARTRQESIRVRIARAVIASPLLLRLVKARRRRKLGAEAARLTVVLLSPPA